MAYVDYLCTDDVHLRVNRREFLGVAAAVGASSTGCLHEGVQALPEYARWLYDSGGDGYQAEYVRPRRIAPVLSDGSAFLGVEVVTTEVVSMPDATVERFVPGNESEYLNSLDGERDAELHEFDVYGTHAIDLDSNFFVEADDRATLERVLASGSSEPGRPENDDDLAEALRLLGESDVVVSGSGDSGVVGDGGVAGGLSMSIAEEHVDVVSCTVFRSEEAVDRDMAEVEAMETLNEIMEVRQEGRSILVSGRAEAEAIAPFVTYGVR